MENQIKRMTIKEALLTALEDLKGELASNGSIYDVIKQKGYYDFGEGKTPNSTVASQLGGFIRSGDSRVKRIKNDAGRFLYYLTKFEDEIDIEATRVRLSSNNSNEPLAVRSEAYLERDLHTLLATYLKDSNIFCKTIHHEQSKVAIDRNQKWVHPDAIGIKYVTLKNKNTRSLLNSVNRADVFKLYSYEIKKEITTDYELKKYYFQAVSNSSWANYGYLVAYEFSPSLKAEMERLNQSFGIGIIELHRNPYESRILLSAKLKAIDYVTVDKLCHINTDFDKFIELAEKLLTATEPHRKSSERELDEFSDIRLTSETDIEDYVTEKHIPVKDSDEQYLPV